MKRITILVFGLLIISSSFAQKDSCLVVRIMNKELSDTSGLSQFYSTSGIYLLQNGIYNFRVNGKKYYLHRIVNISNDSVSIAWGLEDKPVFKFHIHEIDKMTFPSLNNGVSGFPDPTLSQKKYNFKIVKHRPYKIKPAKILIDKEKEEYTEAYFFMTSGYGWKPIYKKNGDTFMIDNSVTLKLKK